MLDNLIQPYANMGNIIKKSSLLIRCQEFSKRLFWMPQRHRMENGELNLSGEVLKPMKYYLFRDLVIKIIV